MKFRIVKRLNVMSELNYYLYGLGPNKVDWLYIHDSKTIEGVTDFARHYELVYEEYEYEVPTVNQKSAPSLIKKD
jgi:dTDP-D-glucose 4,6-dehydratase